MTSGAKAVTEAKRIGPVTGGDGQGREGGSKGRQRRGEMRLFFKKCATT